MIDPNTYGKTHSQLSQIIFSQDYLYGCLQLCACKLYDAPYNMVHAYFDFRTLQKHSQFQLTKL